MRNFLSALLILIFITGPFVSHVYSGEINLALGKKASQSSMGYGGDPQRAVDGKTDGNYYANSVTHTNNGPQEWWQVDLGSIQEIDKIRVWNRTDCCGERLSRFYVLVSERPFRSTNLHDNINQPDVWNAYSESMGGSSREIPIGVAGRYVRIQLSGADYLSLAEVEVIGYQELRHTSRNKKSNLALGKIASQSSTGYGGDAQRAVDGKTDGNYFSNSVTHTNNAPQQWWQVDLGQVQKIDKIKIWNRTDCCKERLSKFYVLISDDPFQSTSLHEALNQPGVWSEFHEGVEGVSKEIDISRSGRFVRIQLAGADYLSLAEVEVFGSSSSRHSSRKKNTNLALGKIANQSSIGYNGDPRRAVDGNTDGNFNSNSVTHTNNAPQQWWQVDLGRSQKIDRIRIWNRTDCCGQRLSNFYVLVSDNPFRSGNLRPSLNQADIWKYYNQGTAGVSTEIEVNTFGRYVRIQLAGSDYLSLAEVEVFGAGRK